MIPKRIFQLRTNAIKIDEVLRQNILKLRSLNPDFEYQLLGESEQIEFLKANYDTKYLELYNSFGRGYGTAKMDFFRYLLIYRTGGIYLDLKSSFSHPLNSFIRQSDSFVVSHWPSTPDHPYGNWGRHSEVPEGEYINGVIIASANNKIMENVIESVCHNIQNYKPFRDGVGHRGVLRVTGPIAYTKAILASANLCEIREIDFFNHGYQVSVYANSNSHVQLTKLHYSKRWNSILTAPRDVEMALFIRHWINKLLRKIKACRLSLR
jgi:hypothetical protein